MANLSGIARPYALAAFECARETHQLPAWKAFLKAAAFITNQPSMIGLIGNPELPADKLFDIFNGVLTAQLELSKEQKNFLLLLWQNNRLNVLPEIAEAYNAHCAALEKISQVRVITAVETTESYRDNLSRALAKRIQREVSLQCEIDPSIIGGAVIHVGDRVIDGSVRGKLSRLLESLTG